MLWNADTNYQDSVFSNPFDSVGYKIKVNKHLGFRNYELISYLGNMFAGISDRKYGEDANTDGQLEWYKPNVLRETDYYAFGSEVKERSVSGGYKFGFNGKENDSETGTQDYGMRIYNPGLGRFLSVDPLTKDYPWLTTYQFASNTPIQAIDLDGKEAIIRNYYSTTEGKILTTTVDGNQLIKTIEVSGSYARSEKISKIEFLNYKKTMYEGYHNSPDFASGKKEYNNGGFQKGKGTLTMASSTNGTYISYSPDEKVSEFSWDIATKALKTFNPIIPIPNKNVEGSGNYSQTVSNFKTGAAIPFGITAAPDMELGYAIRTAATISTVNSADDITSNFSEGGETLVESNFGEHGSAIKAGMNAIGAIGSIYDPANKLKGATAILPNSISAGLDLNGAVINSNKSVNK